MKLFQPMLTYRASTGHDQSSQGIPSSSGQPLQLMPASPSVPYGGKSFSSTWHGVSGQHQPRMTEGSYGASLPYDSVRYQTS